MCGPHSPSVHFASRRIKVTSAGQLMDQWLEILWEQKGSVADQG